MVLPVKRYEAEDVPWTSKVVEGAVVRMPIRLLRASTEKVLVSKDKPLAPPDKVKLVSLTKVQASALAVTVSPVASPMVNAPSTPRVPATSKVKSGVESPIPTLPALLRVDTYKVLDILAGPAKETEPFTSKSPVM